ncbi:MAG: N-acetylmuramoyl-L-alanine amidase [Deltaproteobacteria bacterium]|jgi:N-acetylmuramoyl-L-alanine amidase|nr:N-acetylmuramoyl-L-alanine amidase [Deltaproteobacteria bacterium]
MDPDAHRNVALFNAKLPMRLIVLVVLVEIVFFAGFSMAAPGDLYHEAETCYRNLRQDSQKIKYRHNWMRCIQKFQSVHKQDPDGPWAAAGLFMSAKMYQSLARFSGQPSDLAEARDLFERIVLSYPRSRYRQKAVVELRGMGRPVISKKPEPVAKPGATGSATPKASYISAEACYRDLRNSSQKMKYRSYWQRCIDKFQSVYDTDPEGPWAAAGLFMAATLHQQLHAYSKSADDLETAADIFHQIISEFPDSRYNAKASAELEKMPAAAKKQPVVPADPIGEKIKTSEARQTPSATEQKSVAPSSPDGMVTVTNLRYWSNPKYTRVVVDVDQETRYDHHLLKKDPSINKPQRLYVDLNNSRLGENIRKTIPIHDDLLSDARAGQYTKDSVRVVVDIKSFETYKIFSLKDPFRIVIDVWGSTTARAPDTPGPSDTVKKGGKIPPGSLARQLALGVRRVVIDPGHGGKDFGAPGYLRGVHEKDVVLQIAKRLAKKVKSELGLEVILTRTSDRFLTLEERTAFANTKSADLFVSIHTNASRDRRAYGLETYFLNLATDEEAIRVAAMENATSTKNISDLQKILFDLMQNAKINESSRLAAYVQAATVGHLRAKQYTRVKSKGVKQAPFYVLLGAQMPSILIETGFISNPRECKRLVTPQFQERIAEGIVQGIRKYIQATSPTAFREQPLQSQPRG